MPADAWFVVVKVIVVVPDPLNEAGENVADTPDGIVPAANVTAELKLFWKFTPKE